MAQNGTINVYFHNGEGQEQAQNEVNSNASERVGSQKVNNNEIARSSIISASIQAGKQIINYGFNVMSDLTGDYIQAKQFQEVTNIVSIGAQMLNYPVGTIMAIGQIAVQTATNQWKRYLERQETDLYRQRVGSEAYNNSEVF